MCYCSLEIGLNSLSVNVQEFGGRTGYMQCYFRLIMEDVGTLKTREWKTRDHEKYGGGKRGTGKRGTKFSRVEKAGPPSMERETDKYRCTVYN